MICQFGTEEQTAKDLTAKETETEAQQNKNETGTPETRLIKKEIGMKQNKLNFELEKNEQKYITTKEISSNLIESNVLCATSQAMEFYQSSELENEPTEDYKNCCEKSNQSLFSNGTTSTPTIKTTATTHTDEVESRLYRLMNKKSLSLENYPTSLTRRIQFVSSFKEKLPYQNLSPIKEEINFPDSLQETEFNLSLIGSENLHSQSNILTTLGKQCQI